MAVMQTSTALRLKQRMLSQAEYEPPAAPVATMEAGGNRRWLVSPGIDLLFVCGLAPWILGLLTYLFLGFRLSDPACAPATSSAAVVLMVVSFLVGETHQFTSIVRYCTRKRKLTERSFWLHYPLWLSLLGVALLLVPSWLMNPLLQSTNIISTLQSGSLSIGLFAFLCFPTILMHHFCAQAKAVGFAYCGLNGYQLTNADKR